MSDSTKVSNVDLVKAYLKDVRGNEEFSAKDVANVTGLSTEQASKALRSIPHVQRPSTGVFYVKGRRA